MNFTLTIFRRDGSFETYPYKNSANAIVRFEEELCWESTLYAEVRDPDGKILREDFGDFATNEEMSRFHADRG